MTFTADPASLEAFATALLPRGTAGWIGSATS